MAKSLRSKQGTKNGGWGNQHKAKAISRMPATVYKYYYKSLGILLLIFIIQGFNQKQQPPHKPNLTKEVHDHQMKHQITENKIRKSALRCKILEFLILFIHLDPETNSKNSSSYTRKYS